MEHSLGLSKSYWVVGEFLAGPNFCAWSETETLDNLEELHRVGIRVLVSLLSWEELLWDIGQRDWLEEEIARRGFTHYLFPIQDRATPTRHLTKAILDTIDKELSPPRRIYVHCAAGCGRSGVIVAAWLARHGLATGREVLETLRDIRAGANLFELSPETDEQRAFCASWKQNE